MRFWKKKELSAPINNGWQVVIDEPFSGAWQRNKEKRTDRQCYPTLYACLNRVSSDISKLPYQLVTLKNGIYQVINLTDFDDLLANPNNYQNELQFRESWLLSKLTHGNTYVLKVRSGTRVLALHVLDPKRVKPLVTEAGEVYYELNYTSNNNLLPADYPSDKLIIPDSEIIHDRMHTLYHPLVGIPPLCAAELVAGKNYKILSASSLFFQNGAQPGGLITAPAGMSQKDSERIKEYWDKNFAEGGQGKVAVIGADMKYQAFAYKAADSQLVEQMRYSDEQICQPFGVPPFKVGIGTIPAGLKVDDLNQLYYSDALQQHIESMETLLTSGLSLPQGVKVRLCLEPLLRMDLGKQAEVEAKLVSAMIKTPDEARHRFGLEPTGGGGTLWGQLQQYPLGMLAARNDIAPTEPEPAPDIDETEQAIKALRGLLYEF